MAKLEAFRNDDGTLISYAWPGGYPVVYLTKDGGVLCPDCANMAEREGLSGDPHDPQWHIVAYAIHFEGSRHYCDHCGAEIESAYGDPDGDGDREAL
ncbi:MAG TPA: hypothetical protein VF212_17605 [Longimicrobiales bacterium]